MTNRTWTHRGLRPQLHFCTNVTKKTRLKHFCNTVLHQLNLLKDTVLLQRDSEQFFYICQVNKLLLWLLVGDWFLGHCKLRLSTGPVLNQWPHNVCVSALRIGISKGVEWWALSSLCPNSFKFASHTATHNTDHSCSDQSGCIPVTIMVKQPAFTATVKKVISIHSL